jgi:hypothetical protein
MTNSINYNDYDDWPTIEAKVPTAGGRLFTKHGEIVAYVGLDGNLQVVREVNASEIASWEAFGIHDPAEQATMMTKIELMIQNLRDKHR